MAEYKVKFEVFEGPLDLLLYLVRKEEVDIYEVNLTKIATEFIQTIEVMRQFDLEIAGEFLVMAATLMYIKSKELLPVDQQVQSEDDDEPEDPRWELIRQLVEYKKFKDAANELQNKEIDQEAIFPHLSVKPDFKSEKQDLQSTVSIFDLINAVNTVLKRFNDRPGEGEIFEDRWTVTEKIELLKREISAGKKIKFTDLFSSLKNRTEVVVTFLALLEMIRMHQIIIFQPEAFGEISIEIAPEDSAISTSDDEPLNVEPST